MRRSEILQWVWPVAIVGGLFMVGSDLVGLTIYLPGLADPAGYHAVASGLILWALTLLLVGLIGLYARLAERESRELLRREALALLWELPPEDEPDKDELAEEETQVKLTIR